MSASQPLPGQYSPYAAGAETAVLRSVGRCILLLIVSFGLWGFAWITPNPPAIGVGVFLVLWIIIVIIAIAASGS